MSKQQTAVEYIMNQLRQLAHNPNTHLGLGDVRITQGLIDELADQAKEMEKEQRIKDYNAGYQDGQCNHINDAENYVNEQNYLNDGTTSI